MYGDYETPVKLTSINYMIYFQWKRRGVRMVVIDMSRRVKRRPVEVKGSIFPPLDIVFGFCEGHPITSSGNEKRKGLHDDCLSLEVNHY